MMFPLQPTTLLTNPLVMIQKKHLQHKACRCIKTLFPQL